jgi:hypothetical protein
MNEIKKEKFAKILGPQLIAVKKTLMQMDKEISDNEGNYGQYTDLMQVIENFLIDELNDP